MQKEKILLVEDNKALSKLIGKKVSKNTEFEVDIAHSLKEAETFINQRNRYFMALLDLNLPDAPNGEVVDYVLSKQIPSIVLTANMDKETRENILQKDVIDYVFKGNMDDVNYIFTMINRLSKNRECKVMVVDDSIVTRNEVKRILTEQMYKVFTAAHGEEALMYLEDNKDMKLILTDYNMPVIDGFELTKKIREDYSKIDMGIIAMTENSDEMISSKFLKIGASDFIKKPFSKEELVCRANNTIETLELIDTISDMANIDLLTGISNRRYFFKEMTTYIKEIEDSGEPFAIGMLDIDDFKNINDTYGHDIGDIVIKDLAKILKENTKGSDIVARFTGEEFSVALKNMDKSEAIEFFVRLRLKIAKYTSIEEDKTINFTASIGVAFNDDENDLEEIINQADMALYNAKNSGKNRVEIAEEL